MPRLWPQAGDLVSGVVKDVKRYGVLVDLGGGVTGLIHISEISHDKISTTHKTFSRGEQIKVRAMASWTYAYI